MDIKFNSGLSSVSKFETDFNNKDFPQQKNDLKLSGKQVKTHVYKVLKMHESLHDLEKKLATAVYSPSLNLSPEEHQIMTKKALDVFEANKNKEVKFEKAFQVLKEAKDLQEALSVSRNILISG